MRLARANSVVFWAQFFLLKEQTNGRFINITSNDLHQMHLVPEASCVGKLVDVYDRYAKTDFPALRDQFDSEFDARYAEFWQGERKQQQTLDAPSSDFAPHKTRLEYDQAVCDAIGIDPSEKDLCKVYRAISEEMVVTRGLTSD